MDGQIPDGESTRTVLRQERRARSARARASGSNCVEMMQLGVTRDEERGLTDAAGSLAEASLRKIWNNADDADYDRL